MNPLPTLKKVLEKSPRNQVDSVDFKVLSPEAIQLKIRVECKRTRTKWFKPKLFTILIYKGEYGWTLSKVEDLSRVNPRVYEQESPYASTFIEQGKVKIHGLSAYSIAAQWYLATLQYGLKTYFRSITE